MGSKISIRNAIDTIFSHNEIIAIWKTGVDHYYYLLWRGEAWRIPDKYKNVTEWKIFGTVAESIYTSDTINIAISERNR